MNMIRDYANIRKYEKNHDAQELWRITQPEVDTLNSELTQIFKNTRVTSSDLCGIEYWERVYAISPQPGDSIEDRRERILEQKRSLPPFSILWLINEISNRVDTEFQVVCENLKLSITFTFEHTPRSIRELIPWLRRIIPSNVLIDVTVITITILRTKIFVGGNISERHSLVLTSDEVLIPVSATLHGASIILEKHGVVLTADEVRASVSGNIHGGGNVFVKTRLKI